MIRVGHVDFDDDVGGAAVHVGHQGALIGLGVDELHGLAGQVVQAVDVLGSLLDDGLGAGVVHPQHGLKQVAGAVLNELADGVQVGGEVGCGGEDALVILALALGVELLEPLAHHGQRGLVVDQDLGALALAIEDVAQRRVLEGGVGGHVAALADLARVLSALHHGLDVHAGCGDGQQTHGGQHGEASANVIRNHEGLIALRVGQRLQCAARLVGGGVDAALRTLLAVLLLQQLLEDAEGDGGLGGGAGLGDDVHGEVALADDLHHVVEVGRGDVVAHEVDLGDAGLANAVVHLALAELDGCARAQVGAADADDNQHVAVALDLLRSRLDAGELFLVVVHRQIEPAQEIAACARAGEQHFVCGVHHDCHLVQFAGIYETGHAGHFEIHCHGNRLQSDCVWHKCLHLL